MQSPLAGSEDQNPLLPRGALPGKTEKREAGRRKMASAQIALNEKRKNNPMYLVKDITGMRFGRWSVVSFSHTRKKSAWWNCVCDCGTRRAVCGSSMRMGRTQSCGCYHRETARRLGESSATHKMTKSSEYRSWTAMKNRCLNRNQPSYKYYGEKGIKVCDRWINSFENFLKDMGFKPTPEHTIERQDNSKGYEPSNCRWATRAEQSLNTTSSRLLTFNDETKTSAEWSREVGIKNSTILARLNEYGWSVERALTERPRKWGR